MMKTCILATLSLLALPAAAQDAREPEATSDRGGFPGLALSGPPKVEIPWNRPGHGRQEITASEYIKRKRDFEDALSVDPVGTDPTPANPEPNAELLNGLNREAAAPIPATVSTVGAAIDSPKAGAERELLAGRRVGDRASERPVCVAAAGNESVGRIERGKIRAEVDRGFVCNRACCRINDQRG